MKPEFGQLRSHPDLPPITSWCQFPPPAASEFSRVAWVRGLPSASHFARVSQGAAGAAAWFQTRQAPPRGSRPRALRAFFSNVDRRGGEEISAAPSTRLRQRSDERDRARARSARRGGPVQRGRRGADCDGRRCRPQRAPLRDRASAPVRAPAQRARAHRPNLELFFFPPFARRSERCD